MGVSPREALDIVELIYYAPALVLSIFIVVKHGFSRQLGWIFICILSLLRIIGASTGIAWVHNPNNESILEAYIITDTIGLSPLLLCLLGMIKRVHESMDYPPIPPRIMRFLNLPVIAALVLAIVGGTNEFSSSSSDANNGHDLIKAAVLIFLVFLFIMAGIVVLTFKNIRQVVPTEKRLVVAGLASLPFLLVRLIYSVISAFDWKSSDFSFLSTSSKAVVIQAILSFLMEVIVVTIYLVTGLLTPAIPRGQASGPAMQLSSQDSYGKQTRPYNPQQEGMA